MTITLAIATDNAHTRHMRWKDHLNPRETQTLADLDETIASAKAQRNTLYNRARRRMYVVMNREGE